MALLSWADNFIPPKCDFSNSKQVNVCLTSPTNNGRPRSWEMGSEPRPVWNSCMTSELEPMGTNMSQGWVFVNIWGDLFKDNCLKSKAKWQALILAGLRTSIKLIVVSTKVDFHIATNYTKPLEKNSLSCPRKVTAILKGPKGKDRPPIAIFRSYHSGRGTTQVTLSSHILMGIQSTRYSFCVREPLVRLWRTTL